MANKTVETDAAVATFVATVDDAEQRADTAALIAMMSEVTGEPARMWGPAIIGFGRYHYKYESGREGEMCRLGFSPRKGKIALYLPTGYPGHAEIMARLGTYKTAKACLYLRRLRDVDSAALKELIAASLAEMDQRYPKG